jgi:DNA-binding response OmpR family regulator
VQVESELGVGSKFTATLPIHYAEPPKMSAGARETAVDTGLAPVLFVDDDIETRFLYEKYLRNSTYQPVCVGTLRDARDVMRRMRPQAIVLDILLRGEDTWRYLNELKSDASTASIPLLVLTSVDDERKGLALGADGYCLKPVSRTSLLERLDTLTGRRVLIIDDDPASRYLIQKLLTGRRACVIEASDGRSGLVAARRSRPSLIFLDLTLPDVGGEQILDALRTDQELQSVPVAIVTSRLLSPVQRAHLESRAQAVLEKSDLSVESTRAFFAASGI